MSSKEKISGIYCIKNILNNKRYIGYAIDIKARWKKHINKLNEHNHPNCYLQSVFDNNGLNIFTFDIIQELPKEEEILKCMEIYWICYFSSYAPDGGGYNLTRGGEGCWGRKYSKETLAKMSEALSGENSPLYGSHWSEERKLQFSNMQMGENNSFFGMKHTEETKKAISKKSAMHRHSEESKKKMSENQMGENNSFYNKKHTTETIQKITDKSAGRKSRKNTSSEYVGVCLRKETGKWRSHIVYNKKFIEIGSFNTEEEAAIAYNNKALELYGPNANINIISSGRLPIV